MQAQLKRFHRYRDITEPSSYGPGVFNSYDISLTLSPNQSGFQARIFDPEMNFALFFDDGAYGDAYDGIYVQGLRSAERGRVIRDLRLYSGYGGTGALTKTQTSARSAVLTMLSGQRQIFDVIDLGSVQGVGQVLDASQPWQHLDVGRVDWDGKASTAGGTITVQGAGTDIWSTNDQFHYVYQALRGDGQISTRIDSFAGPNSWAKAGVMLRESLNESARFAAMYATPGSGAAFQWRSAFGGSSGGISGGTSTVAYADPAIAPVALSAIKAPCWLRVIRSGQVCTGQVSLDNLAWTTVGTVTLGVGQDVYVGLAVSSHVPAALATAVFSGTAMSGLPTPAGSWPPTDLYRDLRGRLVRTADPAGFGVDVAYAYNPIGHPATTPEQQQAIAIAPDRQWQKRTVTDYTGRSLAFTYADAQVSGSWVVSAITVPGGARIGYRYGADGQIANVDLPDGTVSSFSRSYEPVSQCTVVAYDDAAADGTHRRKSAYLTNNFSQHIDGGFAAVYNQASLLIRMVVNGAGEVSYLNGFDASNWGQWWIYEGGNVLRVMGSTFNRYYKSGWRIDTTKTSAARWVGALEDGFYRRDLGGDWNNYSGDTPVAVTLDTGERRTFTYDADRQVTGVGWADGSSASYTYNAWKRLVRESDRLGRVTRRTYDAWQNLTREETGLVVVDGVDTPGPDYAATAWEFYPEGHPNQRMLAAQIDARGNRTDYAYDASNRLVSVTEPADVAGGPRAVTAYTYDAAGRIASATDAGGRTVRYAYDARDRVTCTTYADGSTERAIYGAAGSPDANLLVKSIDRNGVVTTYAYDAAGRRIRTVVADAIASASGAEQSIADPGVRRVETCSYLTGTDLRAVCEHAGERTVYTYDNHNRLIATQVLSTPGSALTTRQTYVGNRLFAVTDPYGRSTYTVYRAEDGATVRTVRGLVPSFTLATPAAAAALVRDLTANPAYVIEDRTLDAAGQVIERIDGRGVRTTYAYDGRGRLAAMTEAADTVPATTTYAYDATGNRVRVTSPRGIVTAMAYTGRNLVQTVTEAVGTADAAVVRTLTYTPTRKPATESDALGRITSFAYGVCCDRLIGITDPAGFRTAFTYDPVGNRLSVTDANGLTTTTVYDARHRPIRVTNAAGESVVTVFDDSLTDGVGIETLATVAPVVAGLGFGAGADGSAVAVTNAAGETTVELRDGLGRPVARIDALGHVRRTAYDAIVDGLVETAQTDATGHVVRSRADAAGRVRLQIDALGTATSSAYDAVGNQLRVRDGAQVGWSATYDARNRMLTRTDSRSVDAGTTGWGYDLDGNRLTEMDAAGKTETSVYDARNRRIALTDRLGGITRFAYDAVGNLTRISDADNEARGGLDAVAGTTQYAYDVRNLLVAEAFPTGQAGRTLRTYAYDAARRLVSRSIGVLSGSAGFTAGDAPPAFLGAAVVTGYAYDAANRLSARSYPDARNDAFAYDPAGRLTAASSARYATVVARAYDAAGRLSSESLTLPDGSLTAGTVSPATYAVGYAYTADDQLAQLAYPTGTVVRRTYTARHELADVSVNGSSVAARTYDAGGRLVRAVSGNGLVETRGHVAGDALVARIDIPGVSGFAYTYDADRRKLAETDSVQAAQSQSFAYDDAGRLTTWSAGTARQQSWDLSLVGDWRSTTRDGTVEARSNNFVHEATQVGSNLLTYDTAGNLTRDEHLTALAWDPENRLIRAVVTPDASPTGFGAVATYRYDALGRRVAKTVQDRTTLFLPAGAQTVVELDRPALPTQAQLTGAEADGTLANAALAPASGGVLSGAVTRINFQPSTVVPPAGFLADTGKAVAVRTNGLTYGWSSAITGQAVVRHGAVPLVEFDTFVQAQSDSATASWSMALPDGSYPVIVVAGDALSTEQTNNLVIGGQSVTDATPATAPAYEAGNFDGYAVQATVSGGVLTIATGAGAYHAKLCFVEVGAKGATIDQAARDRLAALVAKANAQTGASPEAVEGTREFVYGGYVDEVVAYQQTVNGVTKRYYPHYNHLYSVAALTAEKKPDGTVDVVERYTYTAYGKQTITDGTGAIPRSKSSVGWDRGFTGYVADNETGLLHARARQYSPTLGRFVGRDPHRQDARREYIEYDPVPEDGYSGGTMLLYGAIFIPNATDPGGMMPLLVWPGRPCNQPGARVNVEYYEDCEKSCGCTTAMGRELWEYRLVCHRARKRWVVEMLGVNPRLVTPCDAVCPGRSSP